MWRLQLTVSLILAGAILILVLGMAGCAYNWREPAADWKPLRRVYHFEDWTEVMRVCQRYAAFGSVNLACVQFLGSECHLWLPHDSPDWLRKHEEMHCDGWKH